MTQSYRPKSKDKQVDKLIQACIDQWGRESVGWSGKKKIMARPPDDIPRCVQIPHTPGNHRAYMNTRSELRRRGLNV